MIPRTKREIEFGRAKLREIKAMLRMRDKSLVPDADIKEERPYIDYEETIDNEAQLL